MEKENKTRAGSLRAQNQSPVPVISLRCQCAFWRSSAAVGALLPPQLLSETTHLPARRQRGAVSAEHQTSKNLDFVITGCLMPPSNVPWQSVWGSYELLPAVDGFLHVCSPPSPPHPHPSTSTFLGTAAPLSPGTPGNRTPEDGPAEHLRTDGFLPKLPREERPVLLSHLPPSEVTFSSVLPPVGAHRAQLPGARAQQGVIKSRLLLGVLWWHRFMDLPTRSAFPQTITGNAEIFMLKNKGATGRGKGELITDPGAFPEVSSPPGCHRPGPPALACCIPPAALIPSPPGSVLAAAGACARCH